MKILNKISLLILHTKGKRQVVNVDRVDHGSGTFRIFPETDITNFPSDTIAELLREVVDKGQNLELNWAQFHEKSYGKMIAPNGTLENGVWSLPAMALTVNATDRTWGLNLAAAEDGTMSDDPTEQAQRLVLCPLSRGGQFRLRSYLTKEWMCLKDGAFRSTLTKSKAAFFSTEFVCSLCMKLRVEFSSLYNLDGSLHVHVLCASCTLFMVTLGGKLPVHTIVKCTFCSVPVRTVVRESTQFYIVRWGASR